MSARRVLVVVENLFFATRIAATAREQQVEVVISPLRSAAELSRATPPDLVILDLHLAGDPIGFARELKADPTTQGIPIVGFYSHVDQALREAALGAGVDHVLPRSAFTVRLAELLARGAPP